MMGKMRKEFRCAASYVAAARGRTPTAVTTGRRNRRHVEFDPPFDLERDFVKMDTGNWQG